VDIVTVASGYDCLLVGAFSFPHGDAAANRLLSLAKTLRAAGYRPLVVNDGPSAGDVATPGRLSSCGGVDYICLPQAAGGRLVRATRRSTRPLRIAAAVRSAGVRRGRLRWVCVPSGLYTIAMHAALRRLLGGRMLVDVVERHDVSQFARGWRDPYLPRHRYTSWLAARLPDKVLVISDELQDRFGARADTLVLPPAIDVDEYVPHRPREPRGPIRLLYAGSPGRKDLLAEILHGLDRLPAGEQRRAALTIAGVTLPQLSADVGAELLSRLGDSVQALGVVSRAEVHRRLAQADFALLIRPSAGYAKAGFPSKVPESLAAGCPLILNYSSDLRRYLDDGKQVLVCRGATADDIAEALHRALALPDAEWNAMSIAARDTARNRFDYRAWAGPLAEFLGDA
jgi:glycosyltransferase involved in cell wall biosynthesis